MRYVPSSENRSHGASLGAKLRDFCNGTRFRYRPRTVAPGDQSPGANTPAQHDLAAEGGLLLFRVPRAAYDAGPLELVIAHPGHTGASGELFLSS